MILIYISLKITLSLDAVQQKIAPRVAVYLSEILDSPSTIEKVNFELFDKLTLSGVTIQDPKDDTLLVANRISVGVELLPLFKKELSFKSIRIFGFDIRLSKDSLSAPLNIQYLIDRFKSKDKSAQPKKLNLAFKSVLLRRGKITYDIVSEEKTPGKFNTHHLEINNLYSSFSMRVLQADSLNIQCNRLSFEEQSGFTLDQLTFKIKANSQKLHVDNFNMKLPDSYLTVDTLTTEYDSIDAFIKKPAKTKFACNLSSSVNLKDLTAFVPAFSEINEKLIWEAGIQGTLNNIHFKYVRINMDNGVNLSGNGSLLSAPDNDKRHLYGQLDKCEVNVENLRKIVRSVTNSITVLPTWMDGMGNLNFEGTISGYLPEIVAYGKLHSNIGTIQTDLAIKRPKQGNSMQYSGRVSAQKLQLNKLKLPENPFGTATLQINFNLDQQEGKTPSGKVSAMVNDFEYNKYIYREMFFEGFLDGKGFDGLFRLVDPHVQFYLNGTVDLQAQPHRFFFDAWLDQLDLNPLNLTKSEKEEHLSFYIHSNFTGNTADNMDGLLRVMNINYQKGTEKFKMDSLVINSQRENRNSKIAIHSKYLDGMIQGEYSFGSLKASLENTLSHYYPALQMPVKCAEQNSFEFQFNLNNTEELTSIFNLPVTILKPGELNGKYNDTENSISLNLYSPSLLINKKEFSDASVTARNLDKDQLQVEVRAASKNKKGIFTNFYLSTRSQKDNLGVRLLWGNSSEKTYSGDIKFNAEVKEKSFGATQPDIFISILPTEMIMNDTLWIVDPAQIAISKNKVNVSRFSVHKEDQFVRINGDLSNLPEDSLKLELKDMNLGYIFAIFNLGKLGFGGHATGEATISEAFAKPKMNANLKIKAFAFNNFPVGDLDIKGSWNDSIQGILLDGIIHDSTQSYVLGHIFPTRDSIDISFKTNRLKAGFLYPFTESIFSELSGRVTGNARLFGRFSALNVEGKAMINEGRIGIRLLNTAYSFNDSLTLTPQRLSFRNIRAYDLDGHQALINGYLAHTHFKNMNYSLNVRAENMLVYDTHRTADLPFWGKVRGTGSVTLNGSPGLLDVYVDMTTNESTFNLSLDNSGEASEYSFINFINKSPNIREEKFLWNNVSPTTNEDDSKTEINVVMQINATPDITMDVIMDEETNDIIQSNGTGNIRIEYKNTDSEPKLFGKYTIDYGLYNYSFLGATEKRFRLKEGSSVSFNGSPMAADLGISAYYSLNAYLGDLDDSFLTETSSTTRVNCLLNINGYLQQPNISFDVELPNADEDVQRRVQNIISSEDMMNRQMLYLLVFNKFYTPDYLSATQKSNELVSGASSTISGLLNTALSGVMANNWNVGANLRTSDVNFTDVDMQLALSSQLLNNRLLFNGNFGYRDNVLNNSSFVGDFDFEYKLTRTGNFRLKAYNKANEKYYLKSGQNTQGLGIVYKRDFNSWLDFLRFLKKKEK
ncbi:MAG: translocation/assembly module TamB [Bacteroidales bacterium]|nr:translocation/assembly module TamB [Bacteroidales bacterium]